MINKITLLLLLTSLPCSCFAGTLLERTFQHGGITREYDIYLPDGLAKNAPLVFVLHGRTSKKKWIRNNSQMNEVADKGGFAVCYPQGTSAVMPGLDEKPVPHWNVYLTYMDVDDVGFLSDLAMFLHREYKLNPERTFVAGHSNGAHMAYALGVERPDVFRGVASIAGWMSYDAWKRRKDAKPIPVIQIHGLADPVNPIEGYGGNPDRRGLGWGGALHVDDVVKFWVELNGCKNKVTEVLTPRTTVDRYSDGKNNLEVWYYKIAGWPHIWPADGHNPENVSKEGVINASDEIWKFFSKFPVSQSSDADVASSHDVGLGNGYSSSIDPKGVHWHQWRGPEANGVGRTANPPLQWSEKRNIKWKVPIEGQGNASPIVWGDKVFVLSAINTGRVDSSLPKPEDQPKRVFGIKHPNTFYRFEVLCLDRNTGMELWRDTASEHVPHEGTHHDADYASASPTTDGERLYCRFGSAGFYCYDLQGKKLWQRDLGKAYVGASLGEGCSPVVHNDRVVIVRDHARQSTIEVLNAKTGETVWKKDRDEPNAWATPRVVEHSGKTQVITAASNMIRSYDLDSGDIIWQCSGLTGNVTPCPVVEGGVVYCMSGYEGYSLLALPLDARGDISNSDGITWSINKGTPYVPSPVLYDGQLYYTQSNQGILTAVDPESGGTIIERTRLPGISNIYSSPVAADGRVYFTGRNGTTLVIKHSGELEVLASNKLDDEFNSSPAIVGTQILLRGRKSLYCIQASEDRRTANTGKSTVEEKTWIHRLATTRRSVSDAFCYLNRLPEKPYDPDDLRG